MRTPKIYFVYIMASSSGTLYIGITSDMDVRVQQHKHGAFEGFSKKYKTDRLVYVERHAHVLKAIAREKQIKRWRRQKKIALIQSVNPSWRDLSVYGSPQDLIVKKIEPTRFVP